MARQVSCKEWTARVRRIREKAEECGYRVGGSFYRKGTSIEVILQERCSWACEPDHWDEISFRNWEQRGEFWVCVADESQNYRRMVLSEAQLSEKPSRAAIEAWEARKAFFEQHKRGEVQA